MSVAASSAETRTGVLAWLYSINLASLVVEFSFSGVADKGLEACFLGLVVTAAVQVISGSANLKISLSLAFVPATYAMAQLLSICSSVLFNSDSSLLNEELLRIGEIGALNITIFLAVATVIVGHPDPDFFRKILHRSGILILIFTVASIVIQQIYFSDAYNDVNNRVFMLDLHPNWWGMLMYGLVVCAQLGMRGWLRYLAFAVAIYVIVISSSRGALVSVLVFWFLIFCFSLSNKSRFHVFTFVGVVIVMGTIASIAFYDEIISFADYLFLINDHDRGLDTGIVDRIDLYIIGMEAFFSAPLFGNGPGLYSQGPMEILVHNGFIIMLAESGLFLFVNFLAWVYLAISRSAAMRPDISCAIIGYLLLIQTFPRSLNLHFTSLVFMLLLLVGIGNQRKTTIRR